MTVQTDTHFVRAVESHHLYANIFTRLIINSDCTNETRSKGAVRREGKILLSILAGEFLRLSDKFAHS